MRNEAQTHELARYIWRGHRSVQGFASPLLMQILGALDRAQSEAGVPGNVGEIGVHHGRSFIALALMARRDERAVAADLFEMQERNIDRSGKGDYAMFQRNLRRHVPARTHVRILRGDSLEMTGATFADAGGGLFRLFHVDGGHTEAIVAHDVNTANGCLTEAGIIAIDDYFHWMFPAAGDGVRRFLAEHPEANLAPFATGEGRIFLARRPFISNYRAALERQRWPIARQASATTLGEPVVCFQTRALTWRQRLGLALRPGEQRRSSPLLWDLRHRGPRQAVVRYANRTVRRPKARRSDGG